MPQPEKITDEQVLEEIPKQRGNIAAIARTLGVARNTVYRRIQRNEDLQTALEDAREAMLDEAESVLYTKVLEGDTPCLLFFLRTQGKRRGYTERQEFTGADGGALKAAEPKIYIPHNGREKLDLSKLSDEELEHLHRLAKKLNGGKNGRDGHEKS